VQTILYSSLSISLLAALVAMMGKQWLNRYASVELESIIERGRHRKRKMDGMVTWKFDLVMECPPLMLQAALLLLGYALSNYLYVTNKVVASVVIGFTSFGLLFYILIVSAATLSYNCPFQTPLSRVFRFFVRFDNEHKKCLKRSGEWFGRRLNWFQRIFTRKKNRSSLHSSRTPTESPVADPSHRPLWGLYKFDSGCIDWMLGKSLDADVTMAIARVVPEIMWHSDIRAVPLERFYDVLLECFDRSSRPPTVIPGFGEMAYLTAKALVHMISQRLLLSGCELDKAVFESISERHQTMRLEDCEGDSDLKSTLGVLDLVFRNWESPTIMDWQNFSFTIPHHTWMAIILFPHADDILEKRGSLPGDIRGFILHSLRLDPLPPASVVANCLFMVGLVLGFDPPDNGIYAIDQRRVEFAFILYDMRLNLPVTVARSIFRLTGSTRGSLRYSTTRFPHPAKFPVLWRLWSSLPPSPKMKLLREAITYFESLCRLPLLLPTLRRRSGKPLVSPCEAPSSATSFCHWSKILKIFSPFWSITSNLLTEEVETTMSRFRTLCVRWLTPPDLPLRLFGALTQHNPHSFTISAASSRTTSPPSFARLPSSSFLLSATGGSTFPVRS